MKAEGGPSWTEVPLDEWGRVMSLITLGISDDDGDDGEE